MRLKLLILFLVAVFINLPSQNNKGPVNIDILSRIPGSAKGIAYWYQKEKNKQYLFVSRNYNVYCFDISVPTKPNLVDSVYSPYLFTFQSIRAFENSLFSINMNGAIEVYDLNSLPDSVSYKSIWTNYFYNFNNAAFGKTHLFKRVAGDLYAYSLADPLNPVLTDSLHEDIKHIRQINSVYTTGDSLYCLTNTNLYVLNFKNHKFSILDSFEVPFKVQVMPPKLSGAPGSQRFVICSSLGPLSAAFYSAAGNHFQLIHKQFLVPFSGTCALAHLDDSRLVAANPNGGLRIYDISNPQNILETGSFSSRKDTIGTNNTTGILDFCAGLREGLIIAMDTAQGVFILDPKKALQTANPSAPEPELRYDLSLFPDPCNENISIQLKRDFPCKLNILNMLGISVFEKEYPGNVNDQLNTGALGEGAYILKIEGNEGQLTKKFLVFH